MSPLARWAGAAVLRLAAVAWVAVLGTAGEAWAGPGPDSVPHRRHYSVKDSPGYHETPDPESLSVVLGRRPNAPPVSKPFRGGATSMDDLGRKVCGALHVGRTDSLMSFCIREDEFRDILWREFPQSRPATGLTWADAWTILWPRLHAGCSHAGRDYGGHVYQFLGFDRDSVVPYRNFKLHTKLILVARDDEGRIHRWSWLRAVAERKGRFKIYSTDD